MQEVNRKIALGAAWMVCFRLADRSLGLVSTIVLARLLVPADFGVVAMAVSVIAVLELLSAFGFDMALIQNQEADRSHYDTAWTLNVVLGIAIAVFLAAVSRPAAIFYDEPRVQAAVVFLGLGPLIRGFENIGVVAFRKELQFHKEFWYRFGQRLAGFLVTVPLAVILENYWALVIGVLVWRTVGVILSYVIHEYRPRFSLGAKADLFHFSKWLFLSNLFSVLLARSAHFVVGRVVGTRALGFYNVGYDVASMPTTELVAPINRAVFPGYAKMASDLSVLRQGYLNVIALITLFSVPAGVGVALTAEQFVPIVLGEKWGEAIPLIQILAIHGVLQAVQSNLYSVYLALGKPKLLSVISGIYLVAFLILVVALTSGFGVVGAAWACLVSSAVILPVNYGVAFFQLRLKFSSFLGYMWRPVAASSVMAAVVWSVANLESIASAATIPSRILFLAVTVALGAVAYVVLDLALWFLSGKPDGAERFILDKAFALLRRFRGGGPRSGNTRGADSSGLPSC